MANKSNGYVVPEVCPRLLKLLKDPNFIISIVLGVLFYFTNRIRPDLYPISQAYCDQLAQATLAYAAISFGAAIAGMGFTLALPGEDRIRRWSNDKENNDFVELVFVFTWSAVSQLLVIVICLLAMVFGYKVVAGSNPVLLAASLSVVCYSIFELYSVVKSVMQLARAISVEEQCKSKQNATQTSVGKVHEKHIADAGD